MKNLILFSIMLLILNLKAQTNKVITVDDADQFVDAIGSDRTIQLKGSTIYLSNVSSEKSGTNYRFDEEHDGHELVIFGVRNLKILGLGNKPVKIITKPIYGDVIAFNNCDNIVIENVDAGHGPEKGGCTGGVFNFTKCKNIRINKSILYGSGMEGITAETVTNLKCNNTIIRGCTYSIMSLSNCNEFEFSNCEFSDNREFDLINISNCIDVKFNSCAFSNNSTGIEEYSDYSLFNVTQSMSVLLKDCIIESNLTAFFCKKANSIEMSNSKLENNSFKKGNFKQ
ncbi:MAG: right-handed parallel beta-helix repeat-containing protein [Bacteroidota bacterium]|jgi:hypothetical protein